MDNEKWTRGTAVFGSCYIKRWLEGKYDQLSDLPAVAKLKAVSSGTKLGIEAILYTLAAYADQKLTDQSPLGLMAKTVLMDAAPEIASRLMEDVRADLSEASGGDSEAGTPRHAVAARLLALDNKELLSILVSMDEMDEATHAKFMSFVSSSNADEWAKFCALPRDQRKALLLTHEEGVAHSNGGWATNLQSFAKDFWVVFKAWSQKKRDVGIPLLNRYMIALLWVLKTCALLWALAFVICTASVLFGRWMLFVILLGVTAGSIAGISYGRRSQRTWMTAAAMVSSGVAALLALLAASGYPDSVFGVAVFFLIGLPTLALGALVLPLTMTLDVLRSLFPDGYKTLMSAAQMLLSAFFGLLIFAVILLVFPPQNPVAFLFIVPVVIALAAGVGFGLVRTHPTAFLRAPVLIGIGFVFLVCVGVMSMPNLRTKLRSLPKRLDESLVSKPKPVEFASSKNIDFVTTEGEVKIWYAERAEGGYDLYRCEGFGDYYAPDGRKLTKADNKRIRRKIGDWVDQVAAQRAERQRKAEQAEREAAQELAEAQRIAAQLQAEKEREKEAAEQQRRAEEEAKAAEARRESFLIANTLPSKVEYLVCAATSTGEPLDSFASDLAKQLQNKGKPASSTVFSPSFYTKGGFELFFSGKGGKDIQVMPLAEMGDRLLLARCELLSIKASSTVAGLHSANMKCGFRILRSSDGGIVEEFSLSGTGPGVSEEAAKTAAFERIAEQFRERK